MTQAGRRLTESPIDGASRRRRPPRMIWPVAVAGAALIHAGALAAMLAPQPMEDVGEIGAPAVAISLDFTTTRSETTDLPPGPEAEASEAATAAAPQERPVEQAHAPQATPTTTTTEEADRVVSPDPAEQVTEEQTEKPAIQQTDAAPSQESVASEAAAPVELEQAKVGPANAAPVLGTGRSDARVRAAWQKRLVVHLDRNKRYPRSESSKSATVLVSFSIDRTGSLVTANVHQSSGDAAFDRAALEMMKRADPVPAPPPALADDGLTFTVPVVFRARGRK